MPFTAEPQDDLFELLEKIAKGSNTVFVGKFQRGTHESKKVFSAVDLIENFGYPTEDNYNDWYQAYNFLQYGIPLNITRVLNDDSKNSEGYVGFASLGFLYTKHPDVPIYNESVVRYGASDTLEVFAKSKEMIKLNFYDFALRDSNTDLPISTHSLVKVKSTKILPDKFCSFSNTRFNLKINCISKIAVKHPKLIDSAFCGIDNNIEIYTYSGVPLVEAISKDASINNVLLDFPIFTYSGFPLAPDRLITDAGYIASNINLSVNVKSKAINDSIIIESAFSGNSLPNEIFVKAKSVYNDSILSEYALRDTSYPDELPIQSRDVIKKRFQTEYGSRGLYKFNYGIYAYSGVKLSDAYLKDYGKRDFETSLLVNSTSNVVQFHGSASNSAIRGEDGISVNISIETKSNNITVLSNNYKDASFRNLDTGIQLDLRTYPNVPIWRTDRGTIAATPLAESDKFYLFGGEYYYVASEDTFYDLVDSYISLPNQHNSQQSITVSDGTETHTIPLRNIVTTRITDMTSLFEGKVLFNQNIDLWDIRYVNSMYRMFYDAKDFNQDIGSWETRYVTDMEYMFFGAETFNQNLSLWDVISIPSIPDGFADGAVNWVNLDWYPPWGQAFTVTPPYDLSIVYTSDTDDKSILVINSVEVQENGKTMFISRAKPRELYIPSTDFDLDSDGVYIPSTDFELE